MSETVWYEIGVVAVETGRLLLVDPELVNDPNQISCLVDGTGLGDGQYKVEGRYAETPFGRRLAEIRVRFIPEDMEGQPVPPELAEAGRRAETEEWERKRGRN